MMFHLISFSVLSITGAVFKHFCQTVFTGMEVLFTYSITAVDLHQSDLHFLSVATGANYALYTE